VGRDNTVDYAWARYGAKAEAADQATMTHTHPVDEPQHLPGEPCDCGPVCNWTPAHPVAGTCAYPGCGEERDHDAHWHGTRHGYVDHDLSVECHPFSPVAGTWLEETLARAHCGTGHPLDPLPDDAIPCRWHLNRAAETIATPAGQSLAARVAALDVLIEHYEALAGPRAHHLGCECGGTNDGVHSCASFERAWLAVRGGAS
jgi:hypothetical protein